MPCQASGVVASGDTVEIDAGTYVGEVCQWSASNLTLRGVGGLAHLVAPAVIPNGKAIWVIDGHDTTVENVEFSGAAVPDLNGAGIRQEAANLTVLTCYFHDNQEGILTGADPTSTVRIEGSVFDRNGAGDGYSHNMYIGHVGTFILRHSLSREASVGHEVKSRAEVNYIEYDAILDGVAGTASYSVDLPNGGLCYVIGNVIEQGPQSQNSGVVTFAEEGATNAVQEIYVVNNTFMNDLGRGTLVRVVGTPAASQVTNNIFWGGGTALSGPGTLTANVSAVDPLFVNGPAGDYRLQAGSPAIDAGVPPGTGSGYDLTPAFEYGYLAGECPRAILGSAIDAGAFEASVGDTLYRLEVADFTPGWHQRTLDNPTPLLAGLETPPFPMYGLVPPVAASDAIATTAPLVIYVEADYPGVVPAAGILRVTRAPGGAAVSF